MDPLLVVSPHLDDAVLSAGHFLDCWPGAHVVTIFAGRPDEPQVTSFDAHCGFSDSTAALVARWDEDDRAQAVLKSRAIRGPWLDAQYVTDRDVAETADIRAGIGRLAVRIGATKIVGPLGIMHPDHMLVAEAVAGVARDLSIETWAYEDLPNRVLYPEEVVPALDRWRARGFTPTLDFIGAGDLDHKAEAIRCYASQIWALNEHACLVPERFWRQWPV